MKRNVLTLVMVLVTSGLAYGVLPGGEIDATDVQWFDDGDGGQLYVHPTSGLVYDKIYDGFSSSDIGRVYDDPIAPTFQINFDMTRPANERVVRGFRVLQASNWDYGRAWDDGVYEVLTPDGWAPKAAHFGLLGFDRFIGMNEVSLTGAAVRLTEHNYAAVDDIFASNRNAVKWQVELKELQVKEFGPGNTGIVDMLPTAPTSLQRVGNVLSWDPVPGAEGYNVWASATGQSGQDYAPLNFFLAGVVSEDLNSQLVTTTSYDLSAAIAAGMDTTYLTVTTVDLMVDGSFAELANSVYAAEIPEPVTMLLLLGGAGFLARKRK